MIFEIQRFAVFAMRSKFNVLLCFCYEVEICVPFELFSHMSLAIQRFCLNPQRCGPHFVSTVFAHVSSNSMFFY